MHKKLVISVLSAFVFASSAHAFRVHPPRDPEMLKPLLDHIMPPREAIDLGSDTAWEAANVTTGTKWDDPAIKWETTLVPSPVWFQMWNKPPQPNEAYYRRTFTLTAEQAKRGAKIFCELAGPEADVILNGEPVGTSPFWCLPFSFDVTGKLKEGENTINVRIYHGSNYAEGNGKNFPQTFGWLIGMYSGLSRPIHLELYNQVHIENVRIDTKVAGGKRIEIECGVMSDECGVKCADLWVEAECEGLKLSGKVENGKAVLKGDWPEAKLWTPDEPNLYNLEVRLYQGGGSSRDTTTGALPRTPRCVDALRQRFGFREVSIADGRLMFNGYPMINRRDSVGLDDWGCDKINPSEKTMRERIVFFKGRGIVSTRGSAAVAIREMRICDEEGFLYSPLLPTGAGYNRNDPYWSVVSNMVKSAAVQFRNHPSLLNWCLFNEFGQFYGVTSWKEQYPKMCAIGDLQMQYDPAHFWTSCGDAELCPTNPAAAGPAPVRSLHYPVNMSWAGNFPEIAYWYANGKASWQGVARKDKPLFISEDLYHGMNDSFEGMGRWGNDAVYTTDGYIKAWKDALLMCADGYYYGGVSEWNPWFLHSEAKDNRLFDNGNEAMPTWLISRRHGYPNIASGSDFEDELYVYNQSFTKREVTLKRNDICNGKKVKEASETFTVVPGERKELKLAFKVPSVKNLTGYEVEFQLSSSEKNSTVIGRNRLQSTAIENNSYLAKRSFAFNIIPDVKPVPKGTVLLTGGETPLRGMFADMKCIFTNAAEAVASNPRVIVCAGDIAPVEGRTVDAWVENGGRAVRLAPKSEMWSPVRIVDRRGHSYAYRRDASFLPDVPDTLWRVWRPDSYLCNVEVDKPADRDMSVLVDSCDAKGFIGADIVRLVQGKGTWLVTSLPIEPKYDVEPAAKYLASRLIEDEGLAATPVSSGYAFLSKEHPFEKFFKRANFLADVTPREAAVVFADGSHELTAAECEEILTLAKSGKTIFITEAVTNFNASLYEKCGMTLKSAPPYVPGPGPLRNPPLDEYRLDWFTRVTDENTGLMAGLPNTDFFFSTRIVCNYFACKANGSRAERTDTPPFANALIDGGTPLLYPAVLNEAKVGNGRVVVTTLPWTDLAQKYPARIIRVWRTFLNNCGVLTATKTDPHQIISLPVGERKGHLWDAPDKPKNMPAWFDNGDDMRYFPVNLCGWSLAADNKCPVEPFPKDQMTFGGIPFVLVEPTARGGGVSYGGWVSAPSKAGNCLERLWLLAALEDDEGLEAGDQVLDILPWDAENKTWGKRVSDTAGIGKYGVHIGAYRKPITPTEGRIGWEGPSQKTKNARLYVFSLENPCDKSRPLTQVLVRSIGAKGKKIPKLAILGAAWQID